MSFLSRMLFGNPKAAAATATAATAVGGVLYDAFNSGKPHEYNVSTNMGAGTEEQAQAYMLSHSAPGQQTPATVDGVPSHVMGMGPVVTTHNPQTNTTVNTTQPGHLLHPGTVTNSVTHNEDGTNTVNRHGQGTGAFPLLNSAAAPVYWSAVDYFNRLTDGSPADFKAPEGKAQKK